MSSSSQRGWMGGGTVGGSDPDDADREPECEECRGKERPCVRCIPPTPPAPPVEKAQELPPVGSDVYWIGGQRPLRVLSHWRNVVNVETNAPVAGFNCEDLVAFRMADEGKRWRRRDPRPVFRPRPMTEAARLKAKEAIRRLRAKQEGIDETWLDAVVEAHGQGQECERDRVKREIAEWIQGCDKTGMLDFAALKKIVEWGTPPEPRWKEVAKALAHGYEALRAVRPSGHDGDEDSPNCYEDCQLCTVDAAMAEIDHALGLVCQEEPEQNGPHGK